MKKTILTAAALIAISTTAQAEIKYNFKDSAHKADMVCIATYGVGRDVLENKDIEAFKELTNVQNNLILKYAYSKQLNQHVEARKILIKNSWTIDQLSDKITECSKGVDN